jgi:hypothetical protein
MGQRRLGDEGDDGSPSLSTFSKGEFMHNVELGKIITDCPQKDAVHVAVAPVIAAEYLNPGQSIGLQENDTRFAVSKPAKFIGVVDPFLKEGVQKGQKFWMFLNPNTITSLRHDWEHPAFIPSESEAWLRDFADEVQMTYEELLLAAKNYLESGDITCLGFDTPDRVYYDREEFWDHYQKVTNQPVDPDESMFFRCAC